MPSKKQYNLVHNDENDTRIPLHSEEAFHRGIVFNAKFIGSMEVPRPTSRMEIVAAMRRIRYEFKAKSIKKKKVTLEVSVDGLKVMLRKKKFPILQKKQHWLDESKLVLMHHPIYRIFYVSHDSHDLKIFSYIARDSSGNSFRCNVFKSSKKSQAMRVVRTVGQAFEVCHKLSQNNPASGEEAQQQRVDKERASGDGENHRRDIDGYEDEDDRDELGSLQPQPSPASVHKGRLSADISLLGDADDSILDQPCPLRTHHPEVSTMTACPTSPLRHSPLGNSAISDQLMSSELTALKHEIQLLRERLDQQSQQTRAAVAHARLLQDQLAAETAARVEAQARTHQLLVQNKELLEHIAALVSHLREHERMSGVAPGVPASHQASAAGVGAGGVLGPMMGQGTAMPDIGQYNSPWEAQGAAAAAAAGAASSSSCQLYSPLDSYYSAGVPLPSPSPPGFTSPGRASYAEDPPMRYHLHQAHRQLWEGPRPGSAGALYPPDSALQLAGYSAQDWGPSVGLPPSGRNRSAQPQPQQPPPHQSLATVATSSPSSTLPRPARLPGSPCFNDSAGQRQRGGGDGGLSNFRSRSLERPADQQQHHQHRRRQASFIKPLPCAKCVGSDGAHRQPRSPSPTTMPPTPRGPRSPLVLDQPPFCRPSRPGPSERPAAAAILLGESSSSASPPPPSGRPLSPGSMMPRIEESESGDEERREAGPGPRVPARRNSR